MNGNYIKIYRSLLDWEWYTDINTCRLFIHMLLKANWKDGKFKGEEIKRGSFVSSIRTLSAETGLTEREVRTAIMHLKSTQEVTCKSHSKYSVFTVVNYDLFQISDTQNDNQATVKRQSNDIQTTTIEEGKKEKREEDNKYTCAFETLWNAYPRKKEKARAYKSYKARLQDGYSEDALLLAVKRYADECRANRTEDKYIKLAATFLSANTPFLDYLGDYKPDRNKKKGINNFQGREYDMSDLERQLIQ